nr:MAG TPA: hypothetical protein [Caudoviricetes sp.]
MISVTLFLKSVLNIWLLQFYNSALNCTCQYFCAF